MRANTVGKIEVEERSNSVLVCPHILKESLYGCTYEQKSNNENACMAINVTTKCQAGSDKCVYTVNYTFAYSSRRIAQSLPIMESLILGYFS